MLNPTPPALLYDREGRPYYLWDSDLTIEQLWAKLDGDDEDERLYWTGIVLAQAKPDDAIVLLGRERILAAVPRLIGRLGRREPFWTWLTGRWRSHG